ncbi:hypothetical protein D3C81_338420 [compost metagenome]
MQNALFQSVIRQIHFGVPKDMRSIELEFNPQELFFKNLPLFVIRFTIPQINDSPH